MNRTGPDTPDSALSETRVAEAQLVDQSLA